MDDAPLTPRQREVLALIVGHYREHGLPPTFDWLEGRLALSPNAVTGFVAALRRKGYLPPQQKVVRSRALRPVGLAVEVGCAPTPEGDRLRQALGESEVGP